MTVIEGITLGYGVGFIFAYVLAHPKSVLARRNRRQAKAFWKMAQDHEEAAKGHYEAAEKRFQATKQLQAAFYSQLREFDA